MDLATEARQGWIIEQAERLTGRRLAAPTIVTDTSDFMAIDRDAIVELVGHLYLITGTEREKRFGLIDEPKFWVKRALSLLTGRRYILKLVFHEQFRVNVGRLSIRCTRSGEKEGRVLDLVRGDPRFMQGTAATDGRGNLVRVIDFIDGTNLLSFLAALGGPYDEYFVNLLPGLLARAAESFAAIQRLHEVGLCHGDIRNDHLLFDSHARPWRWIDFDLDQDSNAYDVWALGNILHCIVGRGFVTFRETLEKRPELAGKLVDDDASVFFPFRIMNLKAVYPCIPKALNDVLLRFAVGSRTPYDAARQVVEDLGAAMTAMS
jgi:hypothetical protein